MVSFEKTVRLKTYSRTVKIIIIIHIFFINV